LFDEGVVIVLDWIVEANGSIAIGQVATFKASFIQSHNFLKLLGPLELEIFTIFFGINDIFSIVKKTIIL
jgi:hypothetical protein